MKDRDDGPPLPPRQQLLADVLAGARLADDEEVRAARADPAFARMLDELLAVRGRLDRASEAERRAIAEPASPADERIVDIVRRQQPRRRPWMLRPRTWGVLLAAVLMLGLGLGVAWWMHVPDTSRLTLHGQAQLTCSAGYASIAWQADPGARRFEVRVKRGRERIDRSGPLRSQSWQPSEARRSTYGTEVTIELWSIGIDEGDERLLESATFGVDGSRR